MELIAVNVAAIEIGAIFLVLIAIAVVAFLFHVRLLERAVLRNQADLRARWARRPRLSRRSWPSRDPSTGSGSC